MFSRKLGSRLSSIEDMKFRINVARVAFGDMLKIWAQDDTITEDTRLKLYNSCIKAILLYNTSSIALTTKELEAFEAFHRKQLKILLRIFYPEIITNKDLYERAKERPLRIDIAKHRWGLFGHILRQSENTSAWIVMENYFDETGRNRD